MKGVNSCWVWVWVSDVLLCFLSVRVMVWTQKWPITCVYDTHRLSHSQVTFKVSLFQFFLIKLLSGFIKCVNLSLNPLTCRYQTGWSMLSDELDSKPEVTITSLSCSVSGFICDSSNSCVLSFFFFSASGAVCAERVHPPGPGSGGLGAQTLSASAGPGWELALQPAGAARSEHHTTNIYMI